MGSWTSWFTAALRRLRRRLLGNGYRPERTYMRGAGTRNGSRADPRNTG
jgi:hypothetical protein